MIPHQLKAESRKALLTELDRGNSIRLSMQTASMMPAIMPGDVLTITPAFRDNLRCGGILLIESDNDWVVHRLLTLRCVNGTTCAITRGDKADYADPPVPLNKIFGTVTGIRRKNRDMSLESVGSSLNIDDALLLASFPSPELPEERIDVTHGFDTDEFIEEADREGLASLIYYYGRGSQIAIPLKNKYLTILARNTLSLHKLQEVSETLEGIEFILLKGAYLASCIYTSPGLRQFADIDILIKRNDLPVVHKKLTRLGYMRVGADRSPVEIPSESAYLNSVVYQSGEFHTTGSEHVVPSLHIHWHLINSITPKYAFTNMNIDEVWRSAGQTGEGRLTLSPEHLIIHLCEHALRHSFDRLILLRDITEVITRFDADIDWDLLAYDSKRFNLSLPVYCSLLLISKKTGISAPRSVLSALRPEHMGLCERLFMRLATENKRFPEMCNLAYLGNIRSFQGKISFAWRTLFPPKTALSRAYGMEPREIGGSTYILRLLRGIRYVTHAVWLIFLSR